MILFQPVQMQASLILTAGCHFQHKVYTHTYPPTKRNSQQGKNIVDWLTRDFINRHDLTRSTNTRLLCGDTQITFMNHCIYKVKQGSAMNSVFEAKIKFTKLS